MARNREHLWHAYLDGELSAAEASEFENSLTPQQRELLGADLRFERRLAEKLSLPLGIPEDVWQRTLAKLEHAREVDSPGIPRSPARWIWAAISLAAAAMIAFVISGRVSYQEVFGPPPIVLAAEDLSVLVSQTATDATSEAVESFLRAHDVHAGVALDVENLYSVHAQGHQIRFIGAGASEFSGEWVPQLHFDCCSYPEKVVIAHRDSAAAEALKSAFGNEGHVQALRDAGDYLIAVVGKHQAHDLLDTVITPH